jgi:hypothetical protein
MVSLFLRGAGDAAVCLTISGRADLAEQARQCRQSSTMAVVVATMGGLGQMP